MPYPGIDLNALRISVENGHRKWVELGRTLTEFACPHCENSQPCICAPSDTKMVSTGATCIYCGQGSCLDIYADGTVIAKKFVSREKKLDKG